MQYARVLKTKLNKILLKTVCPSTLEIAHSRFNVPPAAAAAAATAAIFLCACERRYAVDMGFYFICFDSSFFGHVFNLLQQVESKIADHCYFYFTLNFYN